MTRRVERLNSLLRDVLSEVVRKEVRNPDISEFTSITKVEITKDLHHAKVYFSVLGTEQERNATLAALKSAASFIAVQASKKMVIRHFPQLEFFADTSVDDHMRIETLLKQIQTESSHNDASEPAND